jgi:glycosyltransferase involved in cell wall biosynthesis
MKIGNACLITIWNKPIFIPNKIMDIDILMATYNGEKYINEQINSIINQSYTDWKLIVRDDGSTDNTIAIIKKVKDVDSRILLINDSLENLGPVGNFEELLKYSTSKYVMFSDQDDVWLPNKIQVSFDRMQIVENLHPGMPILVHTDVTVVDAKLKIQFKSFIKSKKYDVTTTANFYKLVVENCVMGSTVMINSMSKKYILPFNKYVLMHDWWIALIVSHYGKIFFIDDQTSLYRQHGSNEIGMIIIKKNYYFKRLNSILDVVRLNIKYFRMLSGLPFKVSIVKVFYLKIVHQTRYLLRTFIDK